MKEEARRKGKNRDPNPVKIPSWLLNNPMTSGNLGNNYASVMLLMAAVTGGSSESMSAWGILTVGNQSVHTLRIF